MSSDELVTLVEDQGSPCWKQTMEEEMTSIEDN
jgi:hypothetical protein